MTKRYWLNDDDRAELAEMRRAFRGELPRGAEIPEPPVPRTGGGGGVFLLAEDVSGTGPVYAWQGKIDAVTGAITIVDGQTEPFKLYHIEDTLSGARAGYKGTWAWKLGLRVFDFGPCINVCATDAYITPGTPPDGEVGVAYTHTVAFDNLDVDGIEADGLPPDLVIDPDTGEITGEPATAGTYWVTLMGSSESPICLVTRMVKMVIAPEAP